jgi:serine/threonine protein kinase
LSEDFPAVAGFRVGSLMAGYRLEAQAGAGGMAVVFRARDERLNRRIALKLLIPALTADSAFRRRFIAESRAAAAVDDPHIIPVYEAGEASGMLFIAMRFVMGGDLRGVLEREGPLEPGRAVEFISPVASALDAAHAAGLVHRDVKPANILVDRKTGRPDHVYLSDFGVSKGAASSVSLTGPGQFLGTPAYSAPEQIRGLAVDGRTDQYALGCVAYQLLSGELPFARHQGMAVLLAHLSEPPPSLSSRRNLPEAADRVLARALAKSPEDRFGSCGAFADALRKALGQAPYHRGGSSSASGHPRTRIVSPPAERYGSAGVGAEAVSAEPAAAATPFVIAAAAPRSESLHPHRQAQHSVRPALAPPHFQDTVSSAGHLPLDVDPQLTADGPGGRGTGKVPNRTADLAARRAAAPTGVSTARGLPPRDATSIRSLPLRRARLASVAGILLLLVVTAIVIVLVSPGTGRPSAAGTSSPVAGHGNASAGPQSAQASPKTPALSFKVSPGPILTDPASLQSISFCPDGKELFTSNGYLWNLSSLTPTVLPSGGSVAFSPSGTTIALLDGGAGVDILDPETHAVIATLNDADNTFALAAAYSASGTELAVGADSGKVYVWDVGRQALITTLPLRGGPSATSVAFSPDGKELAWPE